jgi:GNAT superfamily N-acetyltransferase
LLATHRQDGATVGFHLARADQADDVMGVLNEAAAWLHERGIAQWPLRFELSWVEDAIRQSETWLVDIDGRVSGTVTVDFSDVVWSDVGGSAAYVHRMAVSRRERGLGAVILAWAEDVARRQGCDAVRLDCVASNYRLRAYYENAGFAYRGDVSVGGAPGQRLDTEPMTRVSRYEKLLGPRPERAEQPALCLRRALVEQPTAGWLWTVRPVLRISSPCQRRGRSQGDRRPTAATQSRG